MAHEIMATTKSKATAAKAPVKRAKSLLSQHGEAAKAKAEGALLLKTLRANGWNLSATSRDLAMGNASAVLRSLDKYGLRDVYEKHKP